MKSLRKASSPTRLLSAGPLTRFGQVAALSACLLFQGCVGIRSPKVAAPNAPEMLHFQSYALPSPVEMTYDVVDGVIFERRHGNKIDDRKPSTVAKRTPIESEWSTFWGVLEDLRIWDWKSSYEPTEPVYDGHSWGFSCQKGSRHVESRGSNAYPQSGQPKRTTTQPVAFDRLEQALDRLVTPNRQSPAPETFR
jgi:hypothetical protein